MYVELANKLNAFDPAAHLSDWSGRNNSGMEGTNGSENSRFNLLRADHPPSIAGLCGFGEMKKIWITSSL